MDGVLLGPLLKSDKIRRDDRGNEFVLVADKGRLSNQDAVLELVFDWLGSDQFAA